MSTFLSRLKKDLEKIKNPQKAKLLQRFFKTGKGEYGEGDIFIGLTVPQEREIAKKYYSLDLHDLKELIESKIHEERMICLFILMHKYKTTNHKKIIFHFYIKNMKHINNWDLVDLSAPSIAGEHLLALEKTCAEQSRVSDDARQFYLIQKLVSALLSKNRRQTGAQSIFNSSENELSRAIQVLSVLAKSESVWERRIAVLATFRFIKEKKFDESLKLAKILLKDKHDLIHKAVGWMLREIGKRDLEMEMKFLNKYYQKMPRTMLRYAIERFPEVTRQHYLSK